MTFSGDDNDDKGDVGWCIQCLHFVCEHRGDTMWYVPVIGNHMCDICSVLFLRFVTKITNQRQKLIMNDTHVLLKWISS